MAFKPIITAGQRRLKTLNLLLQEFVEIKPSANVAQVQTFLIVAIHEGCSLTDIVKTTGWSQSTISRHLLDLGPFLRDKSPGFGLISNERDPMELRKNIYMLTDRGRALVRKVHSFIDTFER